MTGPMPIHNSLVGLERFSCPDVYVVGSYPEGGAERMISCMLSQLWHAPLAGTLLNAGCATPLPNWHSHLALGFCRQICHPRKFFVERFRRDISVSARHRQ